MANLKSFPGNFLTLATITTNVGWNHKVLEIDLDLMTMALRLEYLVYIKIRLKNPTSHEMEIKDSLAGIIAIRYLGQILWAASTFFPPSFRLNDDVVVYFQSMTLYAKALIYY